MSRLPGAVLYVCTLNKVRSPMAAGLTCKLYGEAMQVKSCGLEPSEEVDPMAAVVMGEIGVDLFAHQPVSFDGARLQDFDLIVALSPEAFEQVRTADADGGPEVEFWPVTDPTAGDGSREMRLEAYRQTRRDLEARITERFGPPPEWE
jgi:protein-tyrosine-phosphatase